MDNIFYEAAGAATQKVNWLILSWLPFGCFMEASTQMVSWLSCSWLPFGCFKAQESGTRTSLVIDRWASLFKTRSSIISPTALFFSPTYWAWNLFGEMGKRRILQLKRCAVIWRVKRARIILMSAPNLPPGISTRAWSARVILNQGRMVASASGCCRPRILCKDDQILNNIYMYIYLGTSRVPTSSKSSMASGRRSIMLRKRQLL